MAKNKKNQEPLVFDIWDVVLTCSNEPDDVINRKTFEVHEFFDDEPTIRDLGWKLECLRLGRRLDSPYVLKVKVVKRQAVWKE